MIAGGGSSGRSNSMNINQWEFFLGEILTNPLHIEL